MLKQPNLSTTILPQSWLTGLVALTRRRNCQPRIGVKSLLVGVAALLEKPNLSARIGVKSLLTGLVALTRRRNSTNTILPQSWLTGLVALTRRRNSCQQRFTPILADRSCGAVLKQPNLSARIGVKSLVGVGCFNTAPQLLPTTILPQSWLTGLVALTRQRNSYQPRFYPNRCC